MALPELESQNDAIRLKQANFWRHFYHLWPAAAEPSTLMKFFLPTFIICHSVIKPKAITWPNSVLCWSCGEKIDHCCWRWTYVVWRGCPKICDSCALGTSEASHEPKRYSFEALCHCLRWTFSKCSLRWFIIIFRSDNDFHLRPLIESLFYRQSRKGFLPARSQFFLFLISSIIDSFCQTFSSDLSCFYFDQLVEKAFLANGDNFRTCSE